MYMSRPLGRGKWSTISNYSRTSHIQLDGTPWFGYVKYSNNNYGGSAILTHSKHESH